MTNLLSLPPELHYKIFHHLLLDSSTNKIDPLKVVPLTLISRRLTSIAQSFLYIDIEIGSNRQLQRLLLLGDLKGGNEGLKKFSWKCKSLIFRPKPDAQEIGMDENESEDEDQDFISGRLVERLLDVVEQSWELAGNQGSEESVQEDGRSEARGNLKVLDLRNCKPIHEEVLRHKRCLSGLKDLTLGTGIVPSSEDDNDGNYDSDLITSKRRRREFQPFSLESLTLENNDSEESFNIEFLNRLLLDDCRQLKRLDVSRMGSVESFVDFLEQGYPRTGRLLDEINNPRHISSLNGNNNENKTKTTRMVKDKVAFFGLNLEEVSLPPFESLSQIAFATQLLHHLGTASKYFKLTSDGTPSIRDDDDEDRGNKRKLSYLELPNLSQPHLDRFLIPFLEAISDYSDLFLSIGFRGDPPTHSPMTSVDHEQTPPLLTSILLILQSLFHGPPESPEALMSKATGVLRTIRFVKVERGTSEVSRLCGRLGELVVDVCGSFGCDVEFGPRPRKMEYL